ncbi:MAG TPA: hypothetical protein VF245_11190 [Solirubrobacterales bacterium]
MAQRHVKLTGDVEGSYVIEESLADGRLVVAPEWPSKETSAEAILERAGGERSSATPKPATAPASWGPCFSAVS